jgi:hypothetical protein
LVAALTSRSDHSFWPDDVSLLDAAWFPQLGGVSARDLTDLYLLGLAARRGGRFCTFDTRLAGTLVPHLAPALELIPVD